MFSYAAKLTFNNIKYGKMKYVLDYPRILAYIESYTLKLKEPYYKVIITMQSDYDKGESRSS